MQVKLDETNTLTKQLFEEKNYLKERVEVLNDEIRKLNYEIHDEKVRIRKDKLI